MADRIATRPKLRPVPGFPFREPAAPAGTRRLIGLLCTLAAMAGVTSTARGEDPSTVEFFEKEIRPVLVERCQGCHGGAKVKGGLKLTDRASVLKGGDSGPAAVPGDAEASAIVQVIRYQDEPRMPPSGKLADGEVAALTKWVELGLPWPEAPAEAVVVAPAGPEFRITEEQRQFWSFRPVGKPSPPDVADRAWPIGAIDRFILAPLEAKGLHPAPPASKATLLRRVTFDLIGLPPTPEDVAAFEVDGSPEAWPRVVDRLLADPRHGQRWGRHWLDVARYADTRDVRFTGSMIDITEAFRYRDWVVNALNRDRPYDQFVRDQLAGDLVPGDGPGGFNRDGVVATGLLALGEWGTGDSDKAKMIADLVDDQVDVVGRAFLGLTVACARCHDHKFDPISQADYYGLAGIFFSTHILPGPGDPTMASPMLKMPLVPPSVLAESQKRASRIAELLGTLTTAAAGVAKGQLGTVGASLLAARAFPNRPASQSPADYAAAHNLTPAALDRWRAYLGQADAAVLLDAPSAEVAGLPQGFTWRAPGLGLPWAMLNPTDGELSPLSFHLPPHSVSLHPGGANAGAGVAWTSPMGGTVAIQGRLADGDPNAGDGVTWTLTRRRGESSVPLAGGVIPNAGAQELAAGTGGARLVHVEVEPGDELRLVIRQGAEFSCDTTNVTLAITPTADPASRWDLAADVAPAPADGSARSNPSADRLGHTACWRFLSVADDGRLAPLEALNAWDEASGPDDPARLAAAASLAQEAINRDPNGPLAREILGNAGPLRPDITALPEPSHGPLRSELAALQAIPALPPPDLALAIQEGGVPDTEHSAIGDIRLMVRGDHRRPGPLVPRHVPTIVAGDHPPTIGETGGSGRLELANWITNPAHPLTARVIANRVWQHHFGVGLVRSSGNFGKLGEPPTHPELLDYLASRLMASGWSLKALHREILLSATYQESAEAVAETLKSDPENRLFGRMDRQRLESEELRDALLMVSGELDPSLGGPPTPDLGSSRRTLYVTTNRSDRSSFGPLFDAADPAALVDRRTASTVAPQALFLLNDPFTIARAKALAARLLKDEPADDAARLRRAYRLLFARSPEADEVAAGLASLKSLGESAPADRAWAAFCQVLLCSNEFLYLD